MTEYGGSYPQQEKPLPVTARVYLFVFMYLFLFAVLDWIAQGYLPGWLAWPGQLVPWLLDGGIRLLGPVGKPVLDGMSYMLEQITSVGEGLGGYLVVYWLVFAVLSFVVGSLYDRGLLVIVGIIGMLCLCWLWPNVLSSVYQTRHTNAVKEGDRAMQQRLAPKIAFFRLAGSQQRRQPVGSKPPKPERPTPQPGKTNRPTSEVDTSGGPAPGAKVAAGCSNSEAGVKLACPSPPIWRTGKMADFFTQTLVTGSSLENLKLRWHAGWVASTGKLPGANALFLFSHEEPKAGMTLKGFVKALLNKKEMYPTRASAAEPWSNGVLGEVAATSPLSGKTLFKTLYCIKRPALFVCLGLMEGPDRSGKKAFKEQFAPSMQWITAAGPNEEPKAEQNTDTGKMTVLGQTGVSFKVPTTWRQEKPRDPEVLMRFELPWHTTAGKGFMLVRKLPGLPSSLKKFCKQHRPGTTQGKIRVAANSYIMPGSVGGCLLEMKGSFTLGALNMLSFLFETHDAVYRLDATCCLNGVGLAAHRRELVEQLIPSLTVAPR